MVVQEGGVLQSGRGGQGSWQSASSDSSAVSRTPAPVSRGERDFFIDNLLVRIHCIIEMIRWTGLAPRESEFPFPCKRNPSKTDRALQVRSQRGLCLVWFISRVPYPLTCELTHFQGQKASRHRAISRKWCKFHGLTEIGGKF